MHRFYEAPITYVLILLSSAMFALTLWIGGSIEAISLKTLVDLGALYGPYVVFKAEWWRLLSAMFLHGGMTHILMNMVSLYIVGRAVERYFSRVAYLTIYFFSGLFGGMASLYMHPVSVGVGASGAIFGLFGALAGFFLAHHQQMASYTKAFMQDFGTILGLNLLLGVMVDSIDLSAHIGGLMIGFCGGYVIAKHPTWVWLFSLASLVGLYMAGDALIAYYTQILL